MDGIGWMDGWLAGWLDGWMNGRLCGGMGWDERRETRTEMTYMDTASGIYHRGPWESQSSLTRCPAHGLASLSPGRLMEHFFLPGVSHRGTLEIPVIPANMSNTWSGILAGRFKQHFLLSGVNHIGASEIPVIPADMSGTRSGLLLGRQIDAAFPPASELKWTCWSELP